MSTAGLGLKYFFVDLIGGIIRWPLWWYSKGLVLAAKWAVSAVEGYAKTLAISVWIKNIFVPMFGTHDWQSRIISFFMRSAQIIGRGIALFFWLLLVIILFFAYVFLPVVSVVSVIFHFSGFFI